MAGQGAMEGQAQPKLPVPPVSVTLHDSNHDVLELLVLCSCCHCKHHNWLLSCVAKKSKVKQEVEDEDFSPHTLAMIATLDDSVESKELVQNLKDARCLTASVSCLYMSVYMQSF